MSTGDLPMASRAPLYAVKFVSILSSVIVTGILAYFCDQLWSDGFKIPWTFLILFIASIGTLVAHILTSVISCCCTPMSALLSILIDIPIFILWVIAMSIVTWNMTGTLGHSCSLTNWGNSRGVMVCNIYKTMYAFIFFAALAQLAQVVLDVRARRAHVRLGKYDKMRDSQDLKSSENLQPLAPNSSIHDGPLAVDTSSHEQLQPHQTFRDDRSPSPSLYPPQQEYRDQSPGWVPGQPQQRKPLPIGHSQSYTSSNSGYSSGNNNNNRNYDNYYHGYEDSQSMQMQDFSYQRSQQPTHYDSRAYNSGSAGYEYPQNTYYHGRY